ncbi:MAG: hypothetical protein MUF21_12275 [Gemmatimonadaceae bacterium]|jgi:hypothetical protein|nr:hypothetical protein [Gemmatimonadaceae bacterium]
MMMRSAAARLVGTALALGVAGAAHAQGATNSGTGMPRSDVGGVAIGVFGGGTFPVGTTGDLAPTGWNAGGYVDIGRSVGPFGVRLEGAYHGFGRGDVIDNANGNTNVSFSNRYSIAHAAANLVVGIPANFAGFRPYATGGAGAYFLRNAPQCALGGRVCPGGDVRLTNSSDWRFGLNGGVGAEFGIGSYSAFIDARYHHAFRSLDDLDCLQDGNCGRRSPAQYIPVSAGLIFRFK